MQGIVFINESCCARFYIFVLIDKIKHLSQSRGSVIFALYMISHQGGPKTIFYLRGRGKQDNF